MAKISSHYWEQDMFKNEKKRRSEISFISSPPEIVDDVLECGKCGSKKVFSFQKQTRSRDEAPTTFAKCSKCFNSWRETS